MNIRALEKIVRDFYEISGMEISIIDRRGHSIAACRHAGENFCAYIHRSPKCLDMCVLSDTDEIARAETRGGIHTYLCPFGVMETLVPICSCESVVAFIFVAMGLEKGNNDRATASLAGEAGDNLNPDILCECVEKMPHCTRERFDAYASLLPMMAHYIEVNDLLGENDQSLGQMVKNYIDSNLSRKITLADLSWNLHCSTVTLTEHFRRDFDMTIMQYVMQKRMQLAERLLHEEIPVTEIALRCGFSDVEYFSRCFKSHHGTSPKLWRRDTKYRTPEKEDQTI